MRTFCLSEIFGLVDWFDESKIGGGEKDGEVEGQNCVCLFLSEGKATWVAFFSDNTCYCFCWMLIMRSPIR